MVGSLSSPPISSQKECFQLAQKLWAKCSQLKPEQRLLIALAGIPGAGKSTVARLVAQMLNEFNAKCNDGHEGVAFAVDIPMDGFHYSRAHLEQMPNPAVAVHRRGAAFTFDADAFVSFVLNLRAPVLPSSGPIYAPSFDHAVKDPIMDDIQIHPTSKVVLIEGNYCALNRDPWSRAAVLMDEIWFVDVDREVVRERLAKRHVASGICQDMESAHERIRSTDFLNADDILENLLEVHEIIKM